MRVRLLQPETRAAYATLPLCDLSLEPREFLALRCELGFQSGLATWRGIFLAIDRLPSRD